MIYLYNLPGWLKDAKKLPDVKYWSYNPYLGQHVCNASMSMKFYDNDYNFLFEYPEFNEFDEIEFIDADLVSLIKTCKNRIVLYNITKREVVFDNSFEIRMINGEREFVSARCYLKEKNIIFFTVAVSLPPRGNFTNDHYKVYAYYVDKNEYIELQIQEGWHHGGFVYNNTCVFLDWVRGYSFLTKYNQDLEYEFIDITSEWDSLIDKFYPCYDPHRGQIMFVDRKEWFDGYTYYGNNYSKLAIDLNGKLVPWEPLNRVDNPVKIKKANESDGKPSDDAIEYFINENGITKRAFEEWAIEDIMEEAYTWAWDCLDALKDEYKLRHTYDVFKKVEVRDDIFVIFGVGMLYYECENGGFCQFVLNKKDVYKITIDALKKVGAVKTSKIVEKAMKYFLKNQGDPDYFSRPNPIQMSEDKVYDDLESKFENYLEMTINYLKQRCFTEENN
ncbi:MAG: DMP19 family protein [Christensenellaceae bacterium]|jgi:hypothetical protein|nr:DMP19 family protein [Christensenellaceae bacterium]